MVLDANKLNTVKTCKDKLQPSNPALWIEPKTEMARKQSGSESGHRNKRAQFKD